MKTVVIRAPLLSYSGYGEHSRQIFRWLEKRGDINLISQIVQWGTTTWMINGEMEDGLIGRIMESSKPIEGNPDVSFQVQLPDEWDPSLAKFNVGVSAFVETDKCNPEWIKNINSMDLVIVPTTFVKNTIQNTGNVTTPVIVVHESFNDFVTRNIDPLPIQVDTKFNFLIVGQFTGDDPWCDRKNLFFTIKWLCEAFQDDPDVGIIIKTNHGKGTRIDRGITRNKLSQLVAEVRSGQYPRLHLVHGNLTSEEIAGIYRHESCKCLVSLTRGEGFGLPLLEAAASKVPVIVTNWSGHLDFMKLGKFIPINYNLKQIPGSRSDGRIFIEGSRWAEPIEDDFKRKVKKFRNSYEKPMAWAADLSEKITENFSHEKICSYYNSAWDKYVEKIR